MTLTTHLSRNIAAIMQEQLRRVGIQLELDSFELATFFDQIGKAQFNLYYLISVGGNQGTDIFQFVYYSRYRNPAFNDAIAKLRASTKPADWPPLFDTLERILDPDDGTPTDYCPNPDVDDLARQAASLDDGANGAQKRSLYLRIAGLLTDRGGANRSV